MSDQVLCDGCGEPIDQYSSYFTANVANVQMIDGVLVSAATTQKLDYHPDHLPAMSGAHGQAADG